MNQIKTNKRERGQSMVEFALVLPVVLLLIFGLLEFGRVVNAEISAGHCANELARYGVVQTGNDDQIEAAIVAYAGSDANPVCPTFDLDEEGELAVEVNVAYPAGEATGRAIIVSITYPVEIVVPILREFFPGNGGICDAGTYCATGRAELQMERTSGS